jgi:hypothetical protein
MLMRLTFRTTVMGLLALAALAAASAPAAAEPASGAAERAEQQRLLTQRMAKAYCQAGLGVAPAESGRELLESVALFDLHLARLRQSVLTWRERESLAALEQAWGPFRAVAVERTTRHGCETVNRESDELLRVVGELAREIRGRAPAASVDPLVSVSERQRVLAQKLARLYMVRAWGLDTVALREEIASARNEFAGALARLQESPGSGAAAREELERVARQWVWLDTALEQQDAEPSYGLVVADASDAITRRMEALARIYRQGALMDGPPSAGLPSGGETLPETAEAARVRFAGPPGTPGMGK